MSFFANFVYIHAKFARLRELTSYFSLFAGIHRYAILIPGAGFLGQWLQDYRDGKLAMKDAIMRDYIKMHPEHFELPRTSINIINLSCNFITAIFTVAAREKFGEVFKNWVPMR